MKKTVFILIGVVCLVLGAVGIVLPILPTVPFLLVAGLCFAKGSVRLHRWFTGTKLYQNHVAEYAQTHAMTMQKKWRILLWVTILMGIGFFATNILHARIAIIIVLLGHYYYFLFRMKTLEAEKKNRVSSRLIKFTQKSRRYVILTVLFRWMALLGNILTIFSMALILEKGVMQQASMIQLHKEFLLGAIGIALRFFCIHQSVLFSGYAGREVKQALRNAIYEKMYALGLSYRKEENTASYVQLSVEGVEQIEGYFSAFLPQLFYSIVAPVTLFFVFSFFNIKVALTLLGCVPLIPLSMFIIRKRAGKLMKKHWGGYTDLGQIFLEGLQGLATLRLYDADERHHNMMNDTAEGFRRVTMNVLRMQLGSVTIMDFIAYGGAAVGMGMGAWEYFEGKLPFWGMMLVILLSSEFFLPLRLLGSFFHSSMSGVAAAERIFQLLDIPLPQKGTENACGSDICFQQCSFSYQGERKVLHDISFQVKCPSFIAVVGESGCGKSTLAGIISGIHKNYEGSATIGEKEIKNISEESLIEKVSIVSYNSYLFQGSVKEHLAMGNPCATEEEMYSVLNKVKMDEFVRKHGGLSMPILEQGKNLSGGQKQRLAFARALLRDTDIYLLDEAFSGIDGETEEEMLTLLKKISREKTVLFITHRMAAAQKADQIIVMEDGKIAGYDNPEKLYADCPTYAFLYNTQQATEALQPKEEAISCFASC